MKARSVVTVLGFVAGTNISVSAQAVNVQDSLALVALYDSTNGSNWRRQDNWLAGPVSTWYGITVTGDRATSVELPSNRLRDHIPSAFGNLSGLQFLDLSFNKLTSLPPEIGNLSSLFGLELNNNLLTSLPPEIGNLSSLTNLYLSSNQLTSLPPEIGNLSGLYGLYLGYNQLTSLPPEIGNLSGLYELYLESNQLTSLPPEIGNLSGLPYLDLSFNQLTNLPPEIGNLSSLGGLDLRYNQLTSLPPEIGNLSGLGLLLLEANQLTSLPPEIGNLSSLGNLELSSNQLTTLPPEIGNLSGLQTLYLSYNQLTSLPSGIGNLSNLFTLTLDNNLLTSLLPEIGNLSGLQTLTLSNNYLTFDLETIVKKFPYSFYSPQANIPLHQNGSALSVSAGGTLSNNTYQWFSVEQGFLTTIVGDSVFHPSQSGQYYAAVTNSVCTQLTLYSDTIYYDAVLPVTIISLKAYQQKSIIKVDWTSVTEISLARYEIQRSPNGVCFITIGALAAKGNGTQQTNYSFSDMQPLQRNNYYRLKIYDKDGSTTYSKTVLVNMSSDKTFTIVYPVPAKNMLYVKANGNNTFTLLDQSGKILSTANINGNGTIDVSRFASGLYYLKNNHTGEMQKIVIAK